MMLARLSFCLATLVCLTTTTAVPDDFRAVIAQDLKTLITEQSNKIGLLVQKLAQRNNARPGLSQYHKEYAQRQLATLQKYITRTAPTNTCDEADLLEILESHKATLDYIENNYSHNFTNAPVVDGDVLTARSLSNRNISLSDLVEIYNDVELQLQYVIERIERPSVSIVGQFVRTTDSTIKTLHLDTIASRSLKYLALVAYWTYCTQTKDIPLALIPLKSFLGGVVTKKILVKLIVDIGNPNFNVESLKNNLADLESATKDTLEEGTNKVIKKAAEDTLEGGTNKVIKKAVEFTYEKKSELSKTAPVSGGLGKFGLGKINMESTLFNLAFPALLAPFIYRDMQDLGQWGSQKYSALRAYLLEEQAQVAKSARIESQLEEIRLEEQKRLEHLNTVCFELCINPETVNVEYVARVTEGCTASELDALMHDALAQATKNNTMMSADHVEKSIDTLIRKIAQTEIETCEIKRSLLAAQYAGQAVAHVCLQPCTTLAKVTIMPVGSDAQAIKDGALFTYYTDCSEREMFKEEIIKACCIELAAAVGQEIITGSCSCELLKTSKDRAFAHAYQVILEGMSPELMPKNMVQEKLNQAWRLVETCSDTVKTVLSNHADALKAVAHELSERSTLTGQEVLALVNL